MDFVYKICTKNEWYNFKEIKLWQGTKKDIEDGFIHFSNKDQVEKTLKKYYSDQKNLVLLKIKTNKLEKLVWEDIGNGEKFPHLYSTLDIVNVEDEFELILNKDGSHQLPDFLKKSIAKSKSPLESTKAFLQSIIPAPVFSLKVFTSFASILIDLCVLF